MAQPEIKVSEPVQDRYDAVIIGSGAGGSTLSYRLAQSGHKVLVVERGEILTSQRQNALDAVGKYQHEYTKNTADKRSFVGGQTKFYGSALYRMRESDFHSVEHENGTSPAWPITYQELERYYDEAEVLYHVHGSCNGDPSEPPRVHHFPHPPIPHSSLVLKLVKRLEGLGESISSIPRGLDYGPIGKCVLCSTCDGYYCQIDAKMDAEIAALRPAIASGNVRLMTGTECIRVLTNKHGSKVSGVVLRYLGHEQVIHSEIVAVCAGVPHSASLLRRSRTDKHHEGLGNASGCLGRYLAGHSVGMIFPFMSWRKLPAAHTKTFAINSYYNGAPGWPYPMGVIQIAGQMPFWEQSSYFIRPIAHLVGTHALMCFYMTEALPSRDCGFIFEGDKIVRRVAPIHNSKSFERLRLVAVDLFRRAGYPVLAPRRRHHIWHEVGTARIGISPEDSVVDPNCQVHGIEGLFVVDASVLPSAGAVNTALTIIALALRAGDHISRSLR